MDYIETGKIVNTHGVRGDMRVQVWSDDISAFSSFDRLFLLSDGKYVGRRMTKCAKYKDGALKIVTAKVCADNSDKTAGTILALEKGRGLKISCGEGTLYIETAQFPGSKKMNVEDYARGHEIEIGYVLGQE